MTWYQFFVVSIYFRLMTNSPNNVVQKYRSYLKKANGEPQHQDRVNMSFVDTPETTIGSISSLGLDLQQALAISSQLSTCNIAAIQAGLRTTATTGISIPGQMNHFTEAQIANASNIRYGPGKQLGKKQVNLLHGIPITMEQKQLMHLYQPVESFENMSLQASEEISNFLTCSSSHRDGHQMPQQGQRLPVSQRLISNENLGRVSVMNGTGTSSGGTCIYNPSYLDVSQASSVDFPCCDSMELPGNFSLTRPLEVMPAIGNLEGLENGNFHCESMPFTQNFAQEDLINAIFKQVSFCDNHI